MRKISIGILAMLFAVAVYGAVGLSPLITKALNELEKDANTVHRHAGSVPYHQKEEVAERVRNVIDLLEDALYALEDDGPIIGFGRWIQTNGGECNSVCASVGMRSALSREGAQCVSGENRAASAIGSISFQNGCWPNCSGQMSSSAVSVGRMCYSPGQKRDNDRTDVTMGCFCGGGGIIRE